MQAKARALNKQNNELDKQMTEENDKIMTDLVCYLRVANLSVLEQETVRRDLLQMALDAQTRGETLSQVFGADYQTFCDEIIAALPPRRPLERVLDMLDTVLLCAAVLMLIGIAFSRETYLLIADAIQGNPLHWQIAVTAGGLVCGILILGGAWLIVQLICKAALRPKTQKPPKKWRTFLKLFVLELGILALFMGIAWFGRQPLLQVHLLVACALTAGCFAGHKVMEQLL